jgi:hypothetical protein
MGKCRSKGKIMSDIEVELKRRFEPLIDDRVYGIDEHRDIAKAIVEMVGAIAGPCFVDIFVVIDPPQLKHEFNYSAVQVHLRHDFNGCQACSDCWGFLLPDDKKQVAIIKVVDRNFVVTRFVEAHGIIFIRTLEQLHVRH